MTSATDSAYQASALLLYNFDNQPLAFGTNNTERMRIDSSGNVGIGGIPDADAKFQVVGSVRAAGGLPAAYNFNNGFTFQNSKDAGMFSPANGVVGFATAGAERMRIDSIGNVGIGNYTAAGNTLRYLDLQNSDTGASAGAIIRLITSNAAASGNTSVDLVKYKFGGFILNNNDTNAAVFTAFGVGAYERMRIDSSGNVGIGTNSPGTRLDVYTTLGSSATGVLKLYNGSADRYTGIDFHGVTSEAYNKMAQITVQVTNGGSGGGTAIAGDIIFRTNNSASNVPTEKVRITSTGAIAFNGASNYGDAGQVLTSQGSASSPTWATVSGIPVGGIIMWSGSVASIPSGWTLCNGLNGTPNLQDRFVIAAGSGYNPGDTGGSNDSTLPSHSHTFTGSALGGHAHNFTGSALGGHSHSWDYSPMVGTYYGGGSFAGGSGSTQGTSSVSAGTPSGTIDSQSAGTPSGTINSVGASATGTNRPLYYALAFIMKT
jgi:hypothetical protein